MDDNLNKEHKRDIQARRIAGLYEDTEMPRKYLTTLRTLLRKEQQPTERSHLEQEVALYEKVVDIIEKGNEK